MNEDVSSSKIPMNTVSRGGGRGGKGERRGREGGREGGRESGEGEREAGREGGRWGRGGGRVEDQKCTKGIIFIMINIAMFRSREIFRQL